MSFSEADELVVREALTDKLAAASIPYPLPSPIPFVDKADFWATVGGTNDTQIEIETELISMCVITLRKFEDLLDTCEDDPDIRLTYNLYAFREADLTRKDETITPDDFNRKLLQCERDFMADLFNIRSQFLGLQPLTGLPAGYSGFTNSVSMDQFTREREPCRYLQSIQGFALDLQTAVEVTIQ